MSQAALAILERSPRYIFHERHAFVELVAGFAKQSNEEPNSEIIEKLSSIIGRAISGSYGIPLVSEKKIGLSFLFSNGILFLARPNICDYETFPRIVIT
jgi:hypothetical protein